MITKETAIELVSRPSDDASRGDRLILVSRALKVDLLRERFDDFMDKLQSIVQSSDEQSGAFQLAEIQFSAEITAEGEFKLMGTGVGVEAKSGVTFVLKRQSTPSKRPTTGPVLTETTVKDSQG
jgi:hypothetical protein